ncbi:hypothetical protein B566_EDAN016280 [Ephemera danica]|nr:hypothetical protein B566_EDAN016280 [Ephemera danica]
MLRNSHNRCTCFDIKVHINWKKEIMSLRRPRVFVTHSEIPVSALQLLQEKCDVVVCPVLPVPYFEDLLQYCSDVDAILWISALPMNTAIMDAAGPNLRAVVVMAAGYNMLDVAEARRRGIKLGFTPKVNSRSVSEIAIALLLEVTRRIPEARDCIYKNLWTPFRPQWMMGKDIAGSTMGIVGFGAIGQAIARRLQGFEIARFIYCGPRKKIEGDEVGAEFVNFKDLLRQSDFIIVACPLNEDTRHLFNDEAFALMKPTAIFINIARGDIVDQKALIRALENGTIWGAGLDVTTPEPLPVDHPIFKLKNCDKNSAIMSETKQSDARKPRVLVTHSEIPQIGISMLQEKCDVTICPELPFPTRAQILSRVNGVDALFWSTHEAMNKEVMDAVGPNLRAVSTMSAGGCWEVGRPQWLLGKDIVNSTVGIVGLGGIGQAIAKRLKSFEISRLLYCGNNKKPEGDALGAEFVSFETLLRQSDFVVVSCPLNDATKFLFNDETFALMKRSAVFVNISRGGIVDQGALVRALESGTIWGAGLDVTTPEPLPLDHLLHKLKNCVISPHLGSATERTRASMAELTARNILDALDGKDMPCSL